MNNDKANRMRNKIKHLMNREKSFDSKLEAQRKRRLVKLSSARYSQSPFARNMMAEFEITDIRHKISDKVSRIIKQSPRSILRDFIAGEKPERKKRAIKISKKKKLTNDFDKINSQRIYIK